MVGRGGLHTALCMLCMEKYGGGAKLIISKKSKKEFLSGVFPFIS